MPLEFTLQRVSGGFPAESTSTHNPDGVAESPRPARARAAVLHRTVADKKSEGNRAWREFYEYGYSAEQRAREAVSDAQDRLYEVATQILQRLVDAASQLGMTEEEIRTQLRNAGFGQTELDTFFTDGYLPYTPPTE